MGTPAEDKPIEAMVYRKLPDGRVSCLLCAHRCLIRPGKKGICQVRENSGGTLYTLVYGHTISKNADPVEKKPLFHFYPGSRAYSIATPGCNSYLDAVNVDLKAFRDKTYRQYVGSGLQPVLDSLKEIKQRGIWLEVTTLLIPGINDDTVELKDTVKFIGRELSTDTPWHISRFMPAYKMTDVPSTPVETLRRAREFGLAEGLHYVYLGNVLESGSGDTLCPECGRVLIQRSGFGVRFNQIRNGGCPYCGAPISGVEMEGKLLSAECYPRGFANEY